MDKLEILREYIKSAKNIVFFGGAGVSTESGIPDFRSENGLYNAEHQFGHSPEELVSYFFYLITIRYNWNKNTLLIINNKEFV